MRMKNEKIDLKDMQPERYPLDRIADSLEGMEVDLERIADALEALAGCTFNTMYGDAFHICGSVSRD